MVAVSSTQSGPSGLAPLPRRTLADERRTAIRLQICQQDPAESLPELRVEDAVDDGVEGRVAVAQPRQELEHHVRDARLADGRHDVDAEEGDPAHEESAHDEAEGYGRFVVHVVVVVRVRRMLRADGRFGDGADVANVLASVQVESGVQSHHDDTRGVEGNDGRHHSVHRGEIKSTRGPEILLQKIRDLLRFVPAEADGQKRHQGRHQPDTGDGHQDHPLGHPPSVPQRVLDVDESVQTYGAQIENGRRGTHHVERDPRVAELRAEHPVAHDVVGDRKSHDKRRHE